jgi:hypothetical protein
MQTAGSEAFDLGRETAETRRLDGLADEPTSEFATLLAVELPPHSAPSESGQSG